MGKKGGKRYKGKNEDRWNNTSGGNNPLAPNAKWMAYYKAQQISTDSDDFEAMIAAFLLPLPASLRINFDCPYSERLKAELKQFEGEMQLELPEEGGAAVGTAADGGGGESASTKGKEKLVELVKTLPWFPEGRGFQLGLDRNMIRKSKDPVVKKLHAWLIGHTDSGMLTRQEAVSMIPPCVLQVEPHHLILDTCAAPGSKTTQILEIIQSGATVAAGAGAAGAGGGGAVVAGEPAGIVVANDCDTQRAYMLTHQCKRLNSPALVITTHMGQFLPNLNKHTLKAERIAQAAEGLPLAAHPDGMYDRVLADVPCSGDGTIRKQPSIMATWGTHAGASLFPVQLAIAMRGAHLLKVGGLLVYSTCSLNPIENEAVVATLLRQAKGSLVLQDSSAVLPSLKRRAGMREWFVFEEGQKEGNRRERKQKEKDERKEKAKQEEEAAAAAVAAGGSMEDDATAGAGAGVLAKAVGEGEDDAEAAVAVKVPHPNPLVAAAEEAGLRHYASWEEVPEHARNTRIHPGMFSPPPASSADSELHLERCMRVMPHDQNTGGFFICVLKKVAPLEKMEQEGSHCVAAQEGGGSQAAATAEEDTPPAKRAKVEEGTATSTKSVGGGGRDGKLLQVEKEYYRLASAELVDPIVEFFQLDASKFPMDQLYVRSDGAPKSITYLTRSVKDHLIDKDLKRDLKIVSTGLKAFEKNSTNSMCGNCKYRIVQEAAHVIEPFMGPKRKVSFTAEDMALLVNRDTRDGGTVLTNPMNPATIAAINALAPGAFLAVCNVNAGAAGAAAGDSGLAGSGAGGKAGGKGGGGLLHGDQLLVVCWRGRGGHLVNVMCNKDALHVVGNRLVDMGVKVTFPLAERKTGAADKRNKGAEAEGAEGSAGGEAGEAP